MKSSRRWWTAIAVLPLAVVGLLAATRPSLAGPDLRHARCYGAPSHDLLRPCRNPRLRLAVVPSPTQAVLEAPEPCVEHKLDALVHACTFGTAPDDATRQVALVGDSHAGHWRAAVQFVARREGWRGTLADRSSCPFTGAEVPVAHGRTVSCRRWNRGVLRWFDRHPEVDTVLVSENAGALALPRAGGSPFRSTEAGYRAAWRALPSTVRRIVVLRDVTVRPLATLDCVEAAIAARRPAGSACAVPRSRALPGDPASVAAHRLRSPRVRVVDLSRFTCSARFCLPVVGGALVNKDQNHMTVDFARTLGPALDAALLRVLPPVAPSRATTEPAG